ncbi:4-hydroxybutyrate dehydrogenase [Spirochaetia bacterium]|nr:4-hydroxybutyrate dehydrogenase [Spirochaetia bacterium]
MSFSVKPTVVECDNLQNFFKQWEVGPSDLIITNEYVLSPHLGGGKAPCDTLFQEQYGKGEPSDQMIDAMLKAGGGKEYGRIIAIGGGTIIDISKLFVFGSGLTCEGIFAGGAALPRKRKLIIIPTTCGTGSEVTGISIVEFKAKGTKIGLAVPALFADEAVLISSLLNTMPYEVFATSSIDALIHAVESYVSPKANDFTRAMGRSAIEKILAGYQGMKGEKKLPEDKVSFLIASTLAGIAFGNAGCAAVHALSYPIGGGYHVPHGKANYMVFAEVFAAYRSLKADLSPLEVVLKNALHDSSADIWKALFTLLDTVLGRQPLGELGVNEQTCAEMAASVIKNQQRLLANNPVKLSEEDIKKIYIRCM